MNTEISSAVLYSLVAIAIVAIVFSVDFYLDGKLTDWIRGEGDTSTDTGTDLTPPGSPSPSPSPSPDPIPPTPTPTPPPFEPVVDPEYRSSYFYEKTLNKTCGNQNVYINNGNGDCSALNPTSSDCRWLEGTFQECQELCDQYDECGGFQYFKTGQHSGGLNMTGSGACYFRANPEVIVGNNNNTDCYRKGEEIIGAGFGCSQCTPETQGSFEDNTQFMGTKLVAKPEDVPADSVTCTECTFTTNSIPGNGQLYVTRACPGIQPEEKEKMAEICELVCRNYKDGECVAFNFYKGSMQCIFYSSVYGKRWDKPDNISGTPCETE